MHCLADMGVNGSMLSNLAHMYWSTPIVVKSGQERGPLVDSCIGVKQSDPLSPLLFGLFIYMGEAWLQEHAPQCGVCLGKSLLRVLLYADDLTLLASSPPDLQALLDALQQFCVANVDKSAVVVFGIVHPWYCPSDSRGGQPILLLYLLLPCGPCGACYLGAGLCGCLLCSYVSLCLSPWRLQAEIWGRSVLPVRYTQFRGGPGEVNPLHCRQLQGHSTTSNQCWTS
jgi:hypothetical protein